MPPVVRRQPVERGGPRSHDIAPDGRILGVGVAGQGGSTPVMAQQVEFVLNWMEELKQRVPSK